MKATSFAFPGAPYVAMRTALAFLLALSLISWAPAIVHAGPSDDSGRWSDNIAAMLCAGPYAEGEAIVCATEGFDAQTALERVDALTKTEGVMDIAPAALTEATDGLAVPTATSRSTQSGAIFVVRSDTLSTAGLLGALARDPHVIFAEPNYTDICPNDDTGDAQLVNQLATFAEEAEDGAPSREGELVPMRAMAQANDLTSLQWAFDINDATLHAPSAWDTSASMNVPNWNDRNGQGGNMNGTEVIVAVIDGGIEPDHPDLHDALYRFTPEQQSALGCGEYGYNAEAAANSAIDASDVRDRGHHGTHCAGIIAASWDGAGTSGVASDAKVMVIKNGDATSSLIDQLNAYAFIKRACLEQGIRVQVTSNSWMLAQESRALDAAIYDLGESCGIVSVFGAGNSAENLDASLISGAVFKDNPYAVTVAATNAADKLWAFSNYGASTVNVGAPGASIMSTVPYAEEEMTYLSDAVKGTDASLLHEGFDGGATGIALRTVMPGESGDTAIALDSDISTEGFLTGTGSLVTTLGTPYMQRGDSMFMYGIEFDLGAVARPTSGPAYFGCALYANSATHMLAATKATVKARVEQEDGSSEEVWLPASVNPANNSILTGQSWGAISVTLPSATDLAEDFEDAQVDYDDFAVRLYVSTFESGLELFIDSVGVGTQKVPYAFQSGTSMATPAVAGTCAVLAARFPDDTAAERAARVQACVRPNASLAQASTSGGVVDLSRLDNAGSPMAQPAPVIASVTAKGDALVIAGSSFGDVAGSTAVARAGLGDRDANGAFPSLGASVRSWNEHEIVLEGNEAFDGIVEISMTSASGATAHGTFFISPGPTVYERQIALPEQTGDAYRVDDLIDYDTTGIMMSLNGSLYLLPETALIEESPFCQNMWSYDDTSGTWSTRAPLPEPLSCASAVIWDGKLIVKGTNMELLAGPDGTATPRAWDWPLNEDPGAITHALTRVYLYDPASDAWSELVADNVPRGATLATMDGGLALVGGDDETSEASSITAYHPDSGQGDELATLAIARTNPQVVTDQDGALYAYDAQSKSMEVVRDGAGRELVGVFPAFDESADTARSFAATPDGVMMVGPLAKDGSADTYLLRRENSTFEPYARRSSDGKALAPMACAQDDRLFVFAASNIEPQGRFLRSTMTVKQPQSTAEEESPTPATQQTPPSCSTGGLPVRAGDVICIGGVVTLLLAALGAACAVLRARRHTT